MSDRVLAVIVTHNPVLAPLERSVLTLVEQSVDVILIDNGSANVEDITVLCQQAETVSLQSLPDNQGLGAAHNRGIDLAQTQGFDYVLLMDQDSVPMPGMVEALLKAHKRKSEHSQVSAVGVTYLNTDNGSESFFVRFGWLKFSRRYCGDRDEDGCIKADFLISSGSLIKLSTLDRLGNMDESLFIDHVDTEWFLRAHHQGYTAYGVCNAMMQHGLGENTHRVSFAGRQRNVPQHKPFRYYYIFRNSILLFRRRYTSGKWAWNDMQRLLMIFVMFGIVMSPRKANLAMMVKGIAHGVKGITGPLK